MMKKDFIGQSALSVVNAVWQWILSDNQQEVCSNSNVCRGFIQCCTSDKISDIGVME